MFNSREYEWADITIILGGRDLTKIRAVKYKEAREKELVYAKGRKPFGIQSGNDAYDGEIALLQSEYEALKKAGGGSIMGLSLDAVVCYGNPAEGNAIETDKLFGIQFTEAEKDWTQGDKFKEIKLPILFLDLK